MKKNKSLLILLIFAILIQITNSVKAQDVNKAMQYLKAGQNKQAALEFEAALPAIEQQYGKKI